MVAADAGVDAMVVMAGGTMSQDVDCVMLVCFGLSEVQMYDTKMTPKYLNDTKIQ